MDSKKILLFLFPVLLTCNAYGKNIVFANDSLLYHIQDKIYDAFLSSFQDNGPNLLLDIERKLKNTSKQNQMATYWHAYTKYYEAIYYLKKQDKKQANKELTAAITMLENAKNKNSELYALLAFIQSFSIQFSGGMSSAVLSSKVKKNIEAALKLDNTNLRAWYVWASNDYYTPISFGGRKKCEEYLLKAISLEEQSIVNPYLPSWGKSEAFTLLIGYYYDKENISKAKEYLALAQSLYPDNYTINQYNEILKDK